MQLANQRIPDPMLRKIEKRIGAILNIVGANKKVCPVNYGTNYFELPTDWFAACYSYHYRERPIPLPVTEIPEESKKPIFREPEAFSGRVVTESGVDPQPAVFLNGDKNTPGQACHVLVHELIHMNSHNTRGFRGWQNRADEQDGPPEGLDTHGLKVLDEGTTEFFARVVSHGLRREKGGPQITRENVPPPYAYSLAVVCDMAEKAGIKALGKAYFEGAWAGFKTKLAEEVEKSWARTNREQEKADWIERYFGKISEMQIGEHRKHTHEELRKDFGVSIPEPDELQAATRNLSYNDPALALWQRQVRDPEGSVYPALLVLGVVGVAYGAYRIAERRT